MMRTMTMTMTIDKMKRVFCSASAVLCVLLWAGVALGVEEDQKAFVFPITPREDHPVPPADPLSPRNVNQAMEIPVLGLNEKRVTEPALPAKLNDYVSYAIYCWPNEKTPASVWLIVDGIKNQALQDLGDYPRLQLMLDTVRMLGNAYAYGKTRQEPFAQRAAEWLRVWFIDPKTLMNPHLKFCQLRPRLNEKNKWEDQSGIWDLEARGGGIIDMAQLPHTLEAMQKLRESTALSAPEWKAIEAWFERYYQWLIESKQGQFEMKSQNNHFQYYIAQLAAIAQFLGKNKDAKKWIDHAFSRMDDYIMPDGSQPKELTRADGWAYSIYGIDAWVFLAQLGDKCGENYWTYSSPKGASMKKAYEYLIPFTRGDKVWINHRDKKARQIPQDGLDAMKKKLEKSL